MSISGERLLKVQDAKVERQRRINLAIKMKNAGYSHISIGKALGISESSVRSLLKKNDTEDKK